MVTSPLGNLPPAPSASLLLGMSAGHRLLFALFGIVGIWSAIVLGLA